MKYKHLFSPLKIGGVTLKNRIESTPVSFQDNTYEGYFTDTAIAYYENKARGGAAIVTLGEAYANGIIDKAHNSIITLSDPNTLQSLSEVTDAIKKHGSVPSIQILHCGMRANPNMVPDGRVFGPSATDDVYGYPTSIVEEMTEEQIIQVAEDFGNAAEMAQSGGVEMVQIHFGHGWIISQFLSPLTNKRTDKYGGSIENRARLGIMVCENIKKKCGKDFPIEIRIGGDEYAPGGYGLEEGIEICKILEPYVDLFHITAGTFSAPNSAEHMIPSMFTNRNNKLHLSSAIKKAVNKPVLALGGFDKPEYMEELIANGDCDMIGIGRGILADPELVEKARTGDDNIRPCLRCNLCLSGNYIPYVKYARRTVRCRVNPTAGRERTVLNSKLFDYKPVHKNVMVIGGGPGGITAALTALERGCNVTLYEKTDKLGGNVNKGISPDFKSDMKRYRDYLVKSIENSDVKIVYNTEVDKDFIEKEKPDFIVFAIGSDVIRLNIKGVDNKNVYYAEDIALNDIEIGKNVVIIGGGFTGAEESLSLAKEKGHNVDIVEMRDTLIRYDDDGYMHKEALVKNMDETDSLNVHLNSICEEITENSVIIKDVDGNKKTIEADTVIIAIGYKSKSKAVTKMLDNDYRYAVIGDCKNVRTIKEAVHEGYFAGMSI